MPLYVFTRLGIRIGVGELRLKDAGGLITGFAQGVTSRTQHKVVVCQNSINAGC